MTILNDSPKTRKSGIKKKIEKQQSDVLKLGGKSVKLLKDILKKADAEFKKIDFNADSDPKSQTRLLKCLQLAEKVSSNVLKANGVFPSTGGPSTVVTNIINQQNNQIISPVLQSLLGEHIKKLCGGPSETVLLVDGEIVEVEPKQIGAES